MSRGANLSIMGLYNHDSTIFDYMAFPEDFTTEQKETVRDNILVECAELECLYPNPTVMKNIIGIWSKKEVPYWDRMYKAALLEYNPIENYRRSETENISDGKTEQHSGSDVNTSGGSDTNAKTGTDTFAASGSDSIRKTGTDTNAASGQDSSSGSSNSSDTNSGTDTTTNKIAGYDAVAPVIHDLSDIVHGHVVTNAASGTNTQTYGKTDTLTHNTTDTTTYGKTDTETLNTLETITHGKTDTLQHGEQIQHTGSSARSLLAYGNIGVTSSQDMLTQEIELAKIINVIPIIVESFRNRFCLLVY